MVFDYAVALTGSIATGKSSVASIFRNFGFTIIDADRVAHQVLDREYQEIEKLFGSQYITKKNVDKKSVNRKQLGTLIFSDQEAKQKLETLLHPLIYQEIEQCSLPLEEKKKPYIIDIPLFFESNRYPIKKSIVVYTTKEIQLQRLMERDRSTQKEALLRINSQIDIEIKRKKATYLIDNSQDLSILQDECDKIRKKMLTNFL